MEQIISYRDAPAHGIHVGDYLRNFHRYMEPGTYPGRLDALVWGRKDNGILHALVTLDIGDPMRLDAYWQDNRKNPEPFLGFPNFMPGERVNVVVWEGARGAMKAKLEKPSEPTGSGPSWRILRLSDKDGTKALVCHADGFAIPPLDLFRAYQRGAGKGATPNPVFIVSNQPADQSGQVGVRQVLDDEYGLLRLDETIHLIPEWLFRRK